MKHEFNRLKGVQLTDGICFSEEGDTFVMQMKEKGITENMQKNSAAFEAWALVAKSKGYTQVLLEISGIQKGLHYNRFLYRVLRFSEYFKWFKLSTVLNREVNNFVDQYFTGDIKLFYNVPIKEPQKNAANPEAKKERELVKAPDEMNKLLGICVNTYFSQLPVGLFVGKKSVETSIFPRSNAAIDLWGIEDKVFNLIELKVGNNYGLGVLSELFFYSCYINDMYCKKLATYPNKTSYRGFDKLLSANINRVNSYILLDKVHPHLVNSFKELQKCSEIKFVDIVEL